MLGPKRPWEIEFDVRGCSYPPWQLILWPNYFPQPRNCVYCCVCLYVLVCVELEEVSYLINLVCEGTSLRDLEG